jgi:cytochrome c-type biogenesis protein CcmH/NrfG
MPNVEGLCQEARQSIAQGKIEQAHELYLQALDLNAELPDLHYGMATVCFMMNDLESAAYHFKEVIRLDPTRAGAFVNLGAVYNRMEQFDDAIQILRRSIQVDPKRAEGYYNLGLVYKKMGQTNLALQSYLEATRLNPRMVDAQYNLANLYVELGRYNLAIVHYRQVLQLRPNWDKALAGLAQAEEAQNAQRQTETPVEAASEPSEASESKTLDKTVDPFAQGVLLDTLHHATIDSESRNKQFQQTIEQQIEPIIKELSNLLLSPDTKSMELEQCVKRFEAAVTTMLNSQRKLASSLERIYSLGEKLFTG